VVLGDEFGGGGGFDGHEGLPHVAVEEEAFLGEAAVVHLGPVMVDDGVGVGAGLLFEEDALQSRETLGDAIDVAQRVGFEVGVEVCFAEVGPYGVEHEAEDDRIGGAKDAELPADQIIVRGAPFARPSSVENRHEEHGAGHRDDEDHYVLRESQHEGLRISEGWSPSLSKFGSIASVIF